MTTVTNRMEIHTVAGGGGLRLHVREWGNPDGAPILFVHGWSQNRLCWAQAVRQLAGITAHRRLDRPVLVGSSYGPFAILDYIREYGQDAIAAVNFVAGAVKLGEAAFGTLIGPAFLDHVAGATAADLPTNIQALRRFLAGCTACQLSTEDFETALCYHAIVPAQVRAHLAARQLDGDDVLRTLMVPLLVTHGRLDRVVLPAMADHVLATCPTAEASWYDGVGHVPFLESPERFNRELADLVRRAR